MSSFSDEYEVRMRTWQVGASRSSASWRIVLSVNTTHGRGKSAGSFTSFFTKFPWLVNRCGAERAVSGSEMHFGGSEAFENRSRVLPGLEEIQSRIRTGCHHLAGTHAGRMTKIVDEIDGRKERVARRMPPDALDKQSAMRSISGAPR